LTEGEKGLQEAPQKHKSFYGTGAFLIVIMALIIALFTGGIAYGVQGLVGGEAVEGVFIDGVREIRISERQWSFEPAIIKVNPGDRVRFILTSMDISHGFSVNELDINLALSPEEEIIHEVVIPADIAEGIYTMYCSVFCGIGHPYMKGNTIIGTPSSLLGIDMGQILPYIGTLVMAGMFATFIVIGRRRAG
jgi:heme/copper-type cytochrome/quinol oxidase subunit 2